MATFSQLNDRDLSCGCVWIASFTLGAFLFNSKIIHFVLVFFFLDLYAFVWRIELFNVKIRRGGIILFDSIKVYINKIN